jgi:hypothetical protein
MMAWATDSQVVSQALTSFPAAAPITIRGVGALRSSRYRGWPRASTTSLACLDQTRSAVS